MKYLLLLSLLLIGCSRKEPELHYDDKITVKEGFYRGCKGRVKSINNRGGCYDIELDYDCGYSGVCLDYDKPEAWR